MKEYPLVTVLMPCYNAMPYLPEALESIINQTYTNLEILCINDGSTDNTGEVLEKYAQNDKRIRVVHNEKNIKLIATLNKGVELANGKYIARMDADDISFPERIVSMISVFLDNPDVDVLCSRSVNVAENGDFINKNVIRVKTAKGLFFCSFFCSAYGHAETVLKTEVLKNNKYLENERVLHTEDYELYTRLTHKGYRLVFIDDILYSIRINSQSVSRKYTELQDANFVFQANKFYNSYTNKQLSINCSKVITNRVDKTISISEFSHALKELKWFKSFFLNKEKADSVDLREIKTVYKTHLFDICFQTFKRSSMLLKIYCLPYLVYYTSVSLCSKDGRAYLMNKRKR